MESVSYSSDSLIRRKNTLVGENIFLFVPNLIGYTRIILSLLSFTFMPFQPAVAATCYLLSVVLDEFDGRAARKFNQATTFGSMLDMITDRCTTAGLLMFLCYLYPKYLLLFQILLILDVAGHWMLTHASLVHSQGSHKAVDYNRLLQFYYRPAVLSSLVFANELFFISRYLLYFTSGPEVSIFGHTLGLWSVTAITTCPLFVFKHVVINIIQLVTSCNRIAAYDVITRAKRQDFALSQRNGNPSVRNFL